MNSQRGGRLLELAKRYGILDDPEVQNLVLAANLSSNEVLEDSAEKVILSKAVEHWRYPFESQSDVGGVELGKMFGGIPYYLHSDKLTKHFLAVGQSGSGKTTLFYSLMTGVEKPFWAFDLKQDHPSLVSQGIA